MLFGIGITGAGGKEKKTEQADILCIYDTFSLLRYPVS
jgi:hypothetical protein